MFIRKTTQGYYDNAGQHSGRGEYLMLFSWNHFKAMAELRAACEHCAYRETYHKLAAQFPNSYYASKDYEAYHSCYMHRAIGISGPTYANGKGKLWGIVRTVAMHQLGQFMMGTVNIGGKRLTVSGEIGSDGLPDDYQDVPARLRGRLTELPEDLATAFWADNTGWNDVGQVRGKLRQWAQSIRKLARIRSTSITS